MSSSGIFSRSHRDDFGGNSYITLPLPPSKKPPVSPKNADLASEVVAALGEKRYKDAIALAARLDNSQVVLKRKVKIIAYEALEDYDNLVSVLDPQQGVDEAARKISLLIKLRRWDDAEVQLKSSEGVLPTAQLTDFRERIEAGRLFP